MNDAEIKQFVDQNFIISKDKTVPNPMYEIKNGTFLYAGELTIRDVGPTGYIPFPIKPLNGIGGNIQCYETINLKNFTNFPQQLPSGSIWLTGLDLTSQGLLGITNEIQRGSLVFSECQLNNLKHCPRYIKGGLLISQCQLTSLDGIENTSISRVVMNFKKDMPLMKLFAVKNLIGITFYDISNKPVCNSQSPEDTDACQIETIINRYLGNGISAMLPCAAELIKTGFKNYAKL